MEFANPDPRSSTQIRLTRLFLPILTAGVLPTLSILAPRLSHISSAVARLPTPNNTLYCASKSALCAFFDCLRYEVGFQIIAIMPGPVRTDLASIRSLDTKTRDAIMSAGEAGRLACLATERGVREITFPPLDRAMARIRYGNEEGQDVWEGPRSIGDTMRRMIGVPEKDAKL